LTQSEDKIAILIPESLHRSITADIGKKGFASVDDYVVYVLNVVRQERAADTPEAEDERVTRRLKALGYI
jgi:hypothetical protein